MKSLDSSKMTSYSNNVGQTLCKCKKSKCLKLKKTNSNFDGQKHCSCKKSKCLKLYCGCFAAGLYCDDACSCQECFNILDYEDTVDETRQQIELRNPLAFSTKIHNVEDGNSLTTIAGKYKGGCNCKKSMCIKRYCECYQANVKCSDECRCEGCKNVFGKKGEYNVQNESTPWTSSQYSGHIEDASTTDLFAVCYPPSPGSTNFDTILGTVNGNFDDDHLDQQFTLPYTTNISVRYLTSNTELPSTMNWPSGSRASENDSSVIRVPGSLLTPAVSLFGRSKVDDSHEKPVDNIFDNTANAARDTYIQIEAP